MTNFFPSIFVADDDADDRDLIKQAFEANDYRGAIAFAMDGEQLMDKLSSDMPHLILLDLNMPKKDGREVLKEIRASEKYKGIPVIILSTSSLDDDINMSYYLGCNCYITKPSSFTELTIAIKSITDYWLRLYKLPDFN